MNEDIALGYLHHLLVRYANFSKSNAFAEPARDQGMSRRNLALQPHPAQ